MNYLPAPRFLGLFLLLSAGALTGCATLKPGRLSSFEVKRFGAKGDGQTLDTAAINNAITAANAAGGGAVHFPAGNYLAFSIHLQSHVTLQLDAGATLIAADPAPDLSVGYDAPEPNPVTDQYEDFGHAHWHNSFIWGEDLQDVAIIGPGRIFGRGLSRGVGVKDDLPPYTTWPRASHSATPQVSGNITPGPFNYPNDKDSLPAGVGNKAIALKNCRNVLLRDFTVFHGGHFAILATGVDNFTLDNLTLDTNRDGVDIDCCVGVRVSNCAINSPTDDGLCLKSSFGLGHARATENVVITNCIVSGYDEGTLLDGTRRRGPSNEGGPYGRIKFGTEANGGLKNVTIANCVFEYCHGLALEEVDGGTMEDITITNLAMRDIVNAPIFIRLGARLRGPAGITVGTARRIKISNIVAHNVAGQAGIFISGIPGSTIDDVSLSNIFIDYAGGGTAADGERAVPEDEKGYPEPSYFGKLSSWGLFARHVKNLAVDRVEFRAAQDDFRPVVWLEDVRGASFDWCRLPPAPGAPAFVLEDVQDLIISDCPGLPDTKRPGLIASERL